MRKVILVSIILFSSALVGCSALKCGCGGEEKPGEKAPAAASEHKGCGCEGCKKAEGESCSMKK
jgi:hypothetical protein